MTELLTTAFIYLFAAVLIVPISKRLGLGSVLGYLLAGILIGPVLGLVGQETHDIQHIAEFGVVMMLFLVGLELEPAMLWNLRHKLLGLGGLQVILTIMAVAALAVALGQPWQIGIAAGCVMALSSTAIVLQTLGEKGLLGSPGGQSCFSVLLFQDIAVIPMLALLPLLALPELVGLHHGGGHESTTLLEGLNGYLKTLIILAVVGSIIVGGHYLSRPIFRYIAASRLREVYTATALALVVGIAALMNLIGLSPALGAFVAGVVLADSEYRHELESTLEPFKGLLLGLFFITVGAGINFELLFNEIGIILALTFAVILIKALILFILGKAFRLNRPNDLLFALGLAQAGEFGFVLLSFVVKNGIMPNDIAERLLLVVALSMLFTPLLFIFYDKIVTLYAAQGHGTREADVIEEENPIIIVGHGRFGQMVNGLLLSCHYHTTVIDYDTDTVENMTRYGIKTYFGDASRPDLLATAGIAKAKLLVVAIDNREQAISIVAHVRRAHPDLPIIARAYDRFHTYDLYNAGANAIIRETFDAAIRSGRTALEILGMDPEKAKQISDFYYHRDRHSVALMAEAYDPNLPYFANDKMTAISKADDAETDAMIAALLRGEKVDWQPLPDDLTRHKG
ncbi:MAG: monovalent cation:proton antiporter-2 (CPA2) family protein [Cardiobacteriaceae bacterium]|nr:monovalent cation:proton antiporter-2 (CPA2) family protein [Cardiobacteriaceae bacterium]